MLLRSPHSWPALLALAALLPVGPGRPLPARAEVAAPARTVEGVATTPSGRPLARVTLYLFGLPPGQTDMMVLGDQTTVVTDGRGRFTWPVPAALPPLSDYIGVRGIACFALAADRGRERFRLAIPPNRHGADAEWVTRELLQRATRPCETRWVLTGPRPVFSVVVPDTSAVLLALRGPDGRPLRAREVRAVPVGSPSLYSGAVVYTGRTDAEGRLRLRCFPGLFRLQVLVPGVGFGSTGVFEARPGQAAAPRVPPLAPFDRLSGTVAPTLAGADAAISLDDTPFTNEHSWYSPRAAVAADGRWVLADVLPGQHQLVLTNGDADAEPLWVTVQPGERRDGLALGPKKPAPEAGALAQRLLTAPRPPAVTPPAVTPPKAAPVVRGRVTDAAGRPVADADVYAVCSYSQGMGYYHQTVAAGRTDASGVYQVPGLPADDGQTELSVHLVAHRAGSGLAAADWQTERGLISGGWDDIREDLVLPAASAGLTVRVLRDGKLLPDCPVALAAQGERSVIPALYHEPDRGEAARALRALLAPSMRTGPDGVARFTDLTPGLWDVTADRLLFSDPFDEKPAPSNTSLGIIVRAGEETAYTLSLLPPAAPVTFRVLGADGLPPPAFPTSLALATALYHDYISYGGTVLTPEGAGNGRAKFYAPGLFRVRARFGDGPLDVNAPAGPYFEGESLVAVSPATPAHGPVVLPVRRVGPASLRVRLRDARGNPLHGTVTIGNPFNAALYAASADARGVALFSDLPLGKYTVTAYLAGRPAPAKPLRAGGPLPSDAALVAGTGQPLPQPIKIEGGGETLATFGDRPPGYVRLRLTGPLARSSGCYVEARLPTDEAFVDAHFDAAAAEYLVGPLPAGRRTLSLFRYVPAPVATNLDMGQVAVTVKAGRVVHAAVAPRSTAGLEIVYAAPILGTVLLPDGRTPAWGARAAVFVPGWIVPRLMARADTRGRLTLKDLWLDSTRMRETPPGSPAGPVLVAWLPGANGATVVPFRPGQDERLILPAPAALRGRVTVGGRTVRGLPSSFRVRAAYQGLGRLNQALSVDATAQADGTWTLAGLTPGVYQVQAARDGIWLSRTETLTVGAGPPPALTLDIAPPGLPVLLRLQDRAGRPVPHQAVSVARPAGPLTGEVWPGGLVSDGAGLVRLDGLEAGPQALTVSGQPTDRVTVRFAAPPWTPDARPMALPVILTPVP